MGEEEGGDERIWRGHRQAEQGERGKADQQLGGRPRKWGWVKGQVFTLCPQHQASTNIYVIGNKKKIEIDVCHSTEQLPSLLPFLDLEVSFFKI